jgi:hypothetical protein
MSSLPGEPTIVAAAPLQVVAVCANAGIAAGAVSHTVVDSNVAVITPRERSNFEIEEFLYILSRIELFTEYHMKDEEKNLTNSLVSTL